MPRTDVPLSDPYGRCAEAARALLLGLLAGHLILRRVFAHRNMGELLGPQSAGFLRYAFITDVVLAGLLAMAAYVLLRRWRVRSQSVPIGEDALREGLGPAVWLALGFVAYGAVQALMALSASRDLYLVLRQSALAAYALFFVLTVLFFGARKEFIERGAQVAVLTGVACALLDFAGVLKPGWGDTTGHYASEVPYGQMTLPLAILGLGYFIVVSKTWAWRIVAMLALGFVAWRQSVRLPQTVVPASFAFAVGGLTVLALLAGWRGQKQTLSRVTILVVGMLLAGGVVSVFRKQPLAQQEGHAWSVGRYARLLEIYDFTQPPPPGSPPVYSRRDPKRVVTNPEVHKLNAVYEAAGSFSVINNIWRIMVWRRMANEWATQHLVFGAGVGKAWFYPALYDTVFHYGDPRDGLDPHNSYLNVLHRYGLLGFALLAACLSLVAWTVWCALRMQYSVGDPLLEGLVLFTLYALTFAFFTVSLEGPSYALPFWMALGLTYARARQLLVFKGRGESS